MSREDKENLIRLEQEQLTGSAQHEAEIAVKKKDYAQRSKTLMKQLILIKQIKIKILWWVIHNERKPKPNTENQVNSQINGQTINEPCEIANCFNYYFAKR